MYRYSLIITTIMFSAIGALGQSRFSGNPDSAVFVTGDIENFWKAYDEYKKDTTKNPFQEKYIAVGSPGVKGFMANRIKNAGNLLSVVKKREADYLKIRNNTLKMKEKERQCRSTFYALKYWYPQAKFPPVYFVIGAFNSGGTSNGVGLCIGAEKQDDVSNLPYLVAHELIHFQQADISQKPTLLRQSIQEGSADFLGELISGGNINKKANDYGDKNVARLCAEFVKLMDGNDYKDWLYGVSGKDDRPNDLGYWMGYKITEQYYNKAADKRKAVYDILNIKNFKDFLNSSGYLDEYLKK